MVTLVYGTVIPFPYCGTIAGAFTHSTVKSKEFDSSKFTSSAVDTEADAEGRKGARGTSGGEEKRALEFTAHLDNDERTTCEQEEPIPATSSLVGQLNAEDGREDFSTQLNH